MPKVSAKRQITIPVNQCKKAHIEPGDEIEIFIHNNNITIMKKIKEAARGVLLSSDKSGHLALMLK